MHLLFPLPFLLYGRPVSWSEGFTCILVIAPLFSGSQELPPNKNLDSPSVPWCLTFFLEYWYSFIFLFRNTNDVRQQRVIY